MDDQGRVATTITCAGCNYDLKGLHHSEQCPQCRLPVEHSVYSQKATLDQTGHLQFDLPCSECSYDLRTLHFSATCPECGADIGHSIRTQSMMLLNLPWLKKVRKGYILLGFTLGTMIFAPFLSIFMIPQITYMAALWLIGTHNPNIDSTNTRNDPAKNLRRISLLNMVNIASAMLFFAVVSNTPRRATSAIHALTGLGTLFFGITTLVLLIASFFFFLRRSRQFAEQLNHTKVRTLNRVTYDMAITTLVAIIPAVAWVCINYQKNWLISGMGLIIVAVLGIITYLCMILLVTRSYRHFNQLTKKLKNI
jgi:uncharacterized membrane protein